MEIIANYSLGSGDKKFDTADDFIGGTLIALKPVNTLSGITNGKIVKSIAPGKKVGVIYSFIDTQNGLFWELEDHTFVKHSEGTFDKDFLIQTVLSNEAQRAKEVAEAAAAKQIGNPFAGFDLSNKVKWILIIVFVVVLIALFYRVSGK